MNFHPQLRAFNFASWVGEHEHLLKPPVANRLLHEGTGMIVMVVGGPNTRTDFHDDPVEEWFYQYRGDMLLKVHDRGKTYDVPIREGETFFLPSHVPHAPQRPQAGSVGIVVESPRMFGMREAFQWYCFKCEARIHRVEIQLNSATGIVEQLPRVFAAFHDDMQARTCAQCGTLHPGSSAPPQGWVQLQRCVRPPPPS